MSTLTIPATIDAHISGTQPGTNYGADITIAHGAAYLGGVKTQWRRGLVNFNVAALAGTIITSAELVRDISTITGAGGVAARLSRCTRALESPQPRVALGSALAGIAHSAIDISDGLLADLGHICECSQLGAEVHVHAIPRSTTLDRLAGTRAGREALLSGGDDYELCFTAAPGDRARVLAIGRRVGLAVTCIGSMRRGRGVSVLAADGRRIRFGKPGFDHFG